MNSRIGIIVIIVFCFCPSLLAQLKEKTKEKEIIYSGLGKITLETGEALTGKITHSKLHPKRVSFEKEGGRSETYKVRDVKWFTINNAYFGKATTPASILKDTMFVAVLSNFTSPIKVYDFCWQEPIAFGADVDAGVWPTHREQYVYFPAVDKLKPFSDLTFIPFAKKVSKLVEDCPDVVIKINQKEKGYVITLLSTDEDKMNVFINIANLYGQCKEAK